MSGADDKAKPAPEASKPLTAPDFMGLMGVGWKRFEQMDAMSKAIIERLQAERQAEIEFGAALLQCKTPADAFILYTKWAGQRASMFMEDGPKLARLWSQLYTSPLPPSAPLPED